MIIDYKEGDAIVSITDASQCSQFPDGHPEGGEEDHSLDGKIFRAKRIFEDRLLPGILFVDIGLDQPSYFCAGCFRKLGVANKDIFELAKTPTKEIA